MFHTKRRWCIAPVDSPQELASKLTEQTWTLCTAFELRGYLFLNDSTSEDGAQEYAVVAPEGGSFVQLESVTFGWMTKEDSLSFLESLLRNGLEPLYGEVELEGRLDSPGEHGRCSLCA